MIDVPFVIVKDGRTDRVFDIFSRLLNERIIFVRGAITDAQADSIVAQMLYLSNDDANADITMHINSPGGSITAGMAIFDTMQVINPNVCTQCVGQAASMGAILLIGGEKGKRSSLPNSRVLLHQPLLSGQYTKPVTDIQIEAEEMKKIRDRLYGIIAERTNRDIDEVRVDCDRDHWMDAEEALTYGCVDKIVSKSSL